MEELFKKMGRKTGQLYNRSRWYWKSSSGTEEEAIAAEYILGKNLARDLISEIFIDTNPDLNEHLLNIGKELEYPLKNKNRKFHFYIHYTKDVNAYALPGGFIFITYGLLNQIKKEPDELAFVLAHEMMHVVLGHPIQRVYNGYGTKILNVVLSKYTKMGTVSKQVLGQFMNSNYSRDNEFEADAGGAALMTAAGYNSRKAADLLERLEIQSKKRANLLSYFASHPPIDKRVEKLIKR
ncbi:MAG: M48 family metallopeptidase [Fidelibacterota bacterium]